ncbi:MAG: flagellar basal body protein, partial [Burkholderiales bacterium]
MLDRLTDTLNVQAQALLLRSERQRMLASNIANADTPGFAARDMDFAQALRDATRGPAAQANGSSGGSPMLSLAQGGSTGGLAMLATTSAAHFPTVIGEQAERKLLYAQPAQSNLDGNSVDMDRERANFVDNAVKYEATL